MTRKIFTTSIAMICLFISALGATIFYCAFTHPTSYWPFGYHLIIDSWGYVGHVSPAGQTLFYVSPKVSAPITLACAAVFLWWLNRTIEDLKARRSQKPPSPVKPP